MDNAQLIIQDGKTYLPIESLQLWDKNPRGIKDEDFLRLKSQIKKHGQYKPLIINKQGEVLGGNMRLRAMNAIRTAKDDDDKFYMQTRPDAFKNVWVSVVDAETEGKKLEIALSDNDRVGYYEEEKLAELVMSVGDTAELAAYKIDLGELSNIGDILAKFAPVDGDEQPRLDQTENKDLTCPQCGYIGPAKEFTPKGIEDLKEEAGVDEPQA